MMFTINNKKYDAKDMSFNTVCQLEEYGVSIADMKSKNLSMIRAYFALCSNLDPEDAGKEIEAHIIGGGKMKDIMDAMVEEINQSDFFRALKKEEGAEVTEVAAEKKDPTAM